MDALVASSAAGRHGVGSLSGDLSTQLLPLLGRSLRAEFNVFDVMHHGTHEKQLSNVFRWLFEVGETHEFGDLGQRIFLEEINQARGPAASVLPLELYSVRQEVNTAGEGKAADIADLVLESDSAVIVVENYGTSDGHQHSFDSYLTYAKRDDKTGVVVLLCITENRALLARGWEQATVITYERLLDRLVAELDRDASYARKHPEQYAFITQLHRKYASGKERMSSKEVLDFVAAMCTTGEAGRYGTKRQEEAAAQFAKELEQQAYARFGEGRAVLQDVKDHLRAFAENVLRTQLKGSLGEDATISVMNSGVYIYQWTVSLEITSQREPSPATRLHIKFGPSAWKANEQDSDWTKTVDPKFADDSHLFLASVQTHEVRQSSVTMQDVLEGVAETDTRLRDELLDTLRLG